MKKILLPVMLAFFCSGQAQQITIDTTVPSNPAPDNTIMEYWYWASGVKVTGNGFAANTPIKFTAKDPQNGLRSLTSTTDPAGNITFQFNGWTNKSPLGSYTLTAEDSSGKTASGSFDVFKDPQEVIVGTTTPAEFKMSEFATGTKVKVSNLTPNERIFIGVNDPAANGKNINQDQEMYADNNGEYSFDFNESTTLWSGNFSVPLQPVEGKWTFYFNDFSGNGFNGLKGNQSIRVLPNNPSTTSYCPVSATNIEPITFVSFADISNTSAATSNSAYENYLTKVGNIERGKEYQLTVKGNSAAAWKVSTFTAFIDWNKNGILDNDNEIYKVGFIKGSTGTDNLTAEIKIKVPDNAVTGNTRMRILKVNSPSTFAMFWPTGACGNYNYGQAEDYTLNVMEDLASEEITLNKTQFYPNPVKDILSVSSNRKIHSISIFNAAGQMVKTNQNADTIDMGKLKSGIYVIKADIDNKIETFKVIKK